MAVTNFIQSIWSKKIQDDLELKCKLVDNCLRDIKDLSLVSPCR